MSSRAIRSITKLAVGATTSYKPVYCDRVVKLMAEGRSLEGCALPLGVHPGTLYQWLRLYPEFSDAVKAGQAAAMTFWEDRLLVVAQGGPGNFQAIQWALRNRSRAASGWHHDREIVEHTGADGRPPDTETATYDLSRLTGEELDALDRLLQKAGRLSLQSDRSQDSSG